MMQLDFLVPGFSKCATTYLCHLLSQHPDIHFSSEKESNFFSWNYDNGWEWYEKYFNGAKDNQLKGEGSTSYSTVQYSATAAQRIAEIYPNISLIFIARNPIHHIESSFREFHHSGPRFGIDTEFDLDKALTQLPAILSDTKYYERICEFRAYFPDKKIHVLFYEDLIENPECELKSCFRFLQVRDDVIVENFYQILNPGNSKLIDTKVLRNLRNAPWIGPALSKIDIDTQDRIFSCLGLRRRFSSRRKIVWSARIRENVLRELQSDTEMFLDYSRKPRGFWGRDGVKASPHKLMQAE